VSEGALPRRIRWHKPSAEFSTLSLDRVESARAGARPSIVTLSPERRHRLSLLAKVGVPLVEGVVSAKQYALDLLMLAAEVEHALMVQYLYAANSIIIEDGAEENYHRKIVNVAIQEMGHFATVQNLLLLVGGPDAVYVHRDVHRGQSDKDPIPFVLEPLTLTVLAKYVAAEMPAEPPAALAAQVEKLVDLAQQDAGVAPHRVGAIYTVLEWLFMDKEDAVRLMNLTAFFPELDGFGHLTDADLQPADQFEPYQAFKEEWGGADWPTLLVEPARSRKEAVQSIILIAEQGEGLEGSLDSHFHEFIEMVDAFESGKIKTKAIAISPDLGTGHGGERPTPITSAFTRLWGHVLSLQYTLIVLSVQHAIRTPRGTPDDPGLRQKIADLAMRGMRRIIESISNILTALPIADGEAQLAGPPFDLDPADLDVSNASALPARHLELLDRLATLYGEIEQAPGFGNDPAYRIAIANLRNFDRQRRRLFEVPPPLTV
jgi:hypothetical protein